VIHSFSTTGLLAKAARIVDIVFNSVQIFFASSFDKFLVHTSGWTELFNQVYRQYLMLNSLKIPTSIFPFWRGQAGQKQLHIMVLDHKIFGSYGH
jgi:hypothetical protein